jgi:hypothetical protein
LASGLSVILLKVPIISPTFNSFSSDGLLIIPPSHYSKLKINHQLNVLNSSNSKFNIIIHLVKIVYIIFYKLPNTHHGNHSIVPYKHIINQIQKNMAYKLILNGFNPLKHVSNLKYPPPKLFLL